MTASRQNDAAPDSLSFLSEREWVGVKREGGCGERALTLLYFVDNEGPAPHCLRHIMMLLDELDVDAILGVERDQVAPANARPDPRRHRLVCKHWLRGLCKKGDLCDFLHRLDHERMPECFYFSNFGECGNKECTFLHVRPEEKTTECPWYARGFCKHGQRCRHRHTTKKPCPKYLAGFCPDGPSCLMGHMKWELPMLPMNMQPMWQPQSRGFNHR